MFKRKSKLQLFKYNIKNLWDSAKALMKRSHSFKWSNARLEGKEIQNLSMWHMVYMESKKINWKILEVRRNFI